MATSSDIQRFHVDIESRIADLIRLRRVTSNPQPKNWERVPAKTRILFDMFSRGCYDFAEREIGGRCAVFPLNASLADEENQAWAGWHEEWLCVKSREYALIGVGWTFFWGVYGRLSKVQQIFRAEWDETKYRGRVAPQPHWHLDTNIMVGYTTTPRVRRPADSESLVELPPISDSQAALYEIFPAEGLQDISLGGMHLGMGGWSNHSKHPEWWQCRVGEDWNALADWAERTLQSARDQFEELRAKDMVK
jgi:hypothetical protein